MAAIVSSIEDFRALARRRLPPFLFDYIDGGAGAETTLRANRQDLAAVALRQRVLRDVSSVDPSATLFGRRQPLPVALAPVGLAGMYARRGETQAARAAAAAGIPFCLSTVSVCPLGEVAKAAPGPLWFQLYVIKDRGFMRELIATAREAGSEALVFTVDLPTPGLRYRDAHSGMSGAGARLRQIAQTLSRPGWALDVALRGRPHMLGNLAPRLKGARSLGDFVGWIGANFDPSIRWADLDWIRDAWSGPLIIKGVLDVEDAREAVRLGAEGIVVSNHGGRQLDGALSTARALPAIAEAVAGRATVLVDGGISSGLDVVRMLALGADGVLLGRAWAFALAADGERGVRTMLEMIAREMRVTMALTGAKSLADVNREMVA